MAKIELVYDADCPNVEAARRRLRQALAEVGQPAEWTERDRDDPSSPPHVRRFGSPTILVEGADVAGLSPSDEADCCRVYGGDDGRLEGVPSVETIASALRPAHAGDQRGWRSWLAVVPAVGVAMLPKLACPACWPAYAGLLGSVGLGFLVQTQYLFPLTVAFLVVAVGVLAYRASNRHGYGPFLLGLVAATVVVVAKFRIDSDPVMFGGIGLLIAASVWNTWPKRGKENASSCPACAEPESALVNFKTSEGGFRDG